MHMHLKVWNLIGVLERNPNNLAKIVFLCLVHGGLPEQVPKDWACKELLTPWNKYY